MSWQQACFEGDNIVLWSHSEFVGHKVSTDLLFQFIPDQSSLSEGHIGLITVK